MSTVSTEDTPKAGPTRVLVAGPRGRMGSVLLAGLGTVDGLTVVGGLSRSDGYRERDRKLAGADVLVDFTHAATAPDLLLAAIDAGVRPVSGTSGLAEDDLARVDEAARARGISAIWATNYKLGAVLMAHFAAIAARYVDSVEIIEAHHPGKADAPSGTAVALARGIRQSHGRDLIDPPVAKATLPGTRGGAEGGVRVHSIRLPGITGWHEVVFAGEEEVLRIRHDDFGRSSYVTPVAKAIRMVVRPEVVGLVHGYDKVIGLAP